LTLLPLPGARFFGYAVVCMQDQHAHDNVNGDSREIVSLTQNVPKPVPLSNAAIANLLEFAMVVREGLRDLEARGYNIYDGTPPKTADRSEDREAP
jgi:hypothetical protein